MRVLLSGATGKVGRVLEPAIRSAPDLELAGRAAPSLGQTLEEVLDGTSADAVVDFSVPAAALGVCEVAARRRIPLVIGTSGPSAEEWAAAGERARAAGVALVHAPNFAVGAVLMMRFAEEAARHMAAAEIVELHAETKRDRPSGTARVTAARMGGDVPVHSVRLPGLVAHQEVLLGGS